MSQDKLNISRDQKTSQNYVLGPRKDISEIWEHVPGQVKYIPEPEKKSELCPRTKERDLRNTGTCPRTNETYSETRQQVRTMFSLDQRNVRNRTPCPRTE